MVYYWFVSQQEETHETDTGKVDSTKKAFQRRDIRKLKSLKKLEKETKEAMKIERERRMRIEEKQKLVI